MADLCTSIDWWTTTTAPPNLFRPAYQNAQTDVVIRETHGIDPAILVLDLGMSESHIRAYQRQLGLRAFAENNPRQKRAD